jgi:hypothetical protein
MGNYDDDVLGVGNPLHPANKKELPKKSYLDMTIRECLDTYKNTGNDADISAKIEDIISTSEEARKILNRVIRQLRNEGRTEQADFLCIARNLILFI